jgi:FtsP/CotA-like multicopper oxidase with cupredoxin domain
MLHDGGVGQSGLSADSGSSTGASSEAGLARASGQPANFDAELALAEVTDQDPDPDTIEISLEASIKDIEFLPGIPTPAWTYNGSVPGPLIQATVGQTLLVHFKNSLPETTTVHWHGVRLDNEVDGVPGITTKAVEPGEEHDYRFTLRDAGFFWYHPHYDSVAQMGRGLYGGILVSDPSEPDLGQELPLILSDMSLEEDGSFTDDDNGGEFTILFGREGNTLLVNGRVNPTLHARAGLRQRWRVLNASRSRYFGLGFEAQSFTRIGRDGGLQQFPENIDSPVNIVPGSRADLLVAPVAQPNTVSQLQWVPTERGFGSTFNRDPADLFRIQYTDEAPATPPALPEISRTIPDPDLSAAVEHEIELTIDIPDSGLVLGINHESAELVPPIMAKVGDTQVWDLTNHSDFSHPFHLHGFFFQQIDPMGKPIEPRAWLDTIDVPKDQPVRVAVHFDERPGMWMYHCHILDHADGGMMGMVHLEAP